MILLFKVNSRHPFLIAQQVIDILIIRKRLHHIIYRSRIHFPKQIHRLSSGIVIVEEAIDFLVCFQPGQALDRLFTEFSTIKSGCLHGGGNFPCFTSVK